MRTGVICLNPVTIEKWYKRKSQNAFTHSVKTELKSHVLDM